MKTTPFRYAVCLCAALVLSAACGPAARADDAKAAAEKKAAVPAKPAPAKPSPAKPALPTPHLVPALKAPKKAEPEAPPETAAEKEIKACWEMSEMDRRSGIETRMVAGANHTIECLRKAVMTRTENFTPDNRKDFTDALTAYIAKSSAVNWFVYNGGCAKDCGKDAHVSALKGTAADLERILKALDARQPPVP
ncbi:MAG: hypothetical protein GC185_13550 [Alphaproteobacteria bacterium]|nr:hypothetical protein [Alphaproteobacteria bacterium]